MVKLIDNKRFRFWIYPFSLGWNIHRKVFKRWGWIGFFGHIRVSTTIIS